jgi:hypothetical protein
VIGLLAGQKMPPGHVAGPQSRRAYRSTGWALMLLVGFAIFFIVIGVVGGAHPGKSSAGVFYGIFGGFAVLVLALAVLVYMLKKPKRARHFSVTANPTDLRRGDKVNVELQVTDPDKIEGRLKVGVICTELYDERQVSYNKNGQTTHRVVASTVAYEKWNTAAADSRSQSFTFEIPADGPFSHEGAVVTLEWHVTAKEPIEHGRDPISDQPIWVAP